MRDSNYKTVSTNKAAVTITTSLYDRRALDVTSDKPLVNSLNYLTYLVSSLAKVRETLSIDGGIERLIEILHECHNATFNINDNIFNSEKKLLTAWKWTLAFQCLVLVGTRGTERIRQKVVKAGILPIIATVLDNYLSLHERTFIHANSRQQQQQHQSQPLGQLQLQLQQPLTNQQINQQINQQSNQNQQQGAAFISGLSQETISQDPIQAQIINQRLEQLREQQRRGQQLVDPNQLRRQEIPPRATDSIWTNGFDPRQESQMQEHFQQHWQEQQEQNTQQRQQPQQPQQSQTTQQHQPPNSQQNYSTQGSINPQMVELNNMQTPINIATAAIEATSISNTTPYPTYFNNNRSHNLTSDDYDNLTVDQLFKLIRFNAPNLNPSLNKTHTSVTSTINNDIRRRYMIIHIIKKLREEKDTEILDDRFFNDCDYEMDNNLQFLSDLYLQDYDSNKNMINSKISVRNFTETGVLIPRDDDIVWSLQLLAYISKYPYLKDVLQNTHLVIDMSIRDKQLKLYLEKQMKLKLKKSIAIKLRPTISPKSRKSKSTYLERFNPSASNSPQMLNDISGIHDDNFLLEDDKLELCNKPEQTGLTEDAEVEDESDVEEDDEEDDEDSLGNEIDKNLSNSACSHEDMLEVESSINQLATEVLDNSDYVSKLHDSIVDCEATLNDLEREIALFQINEKMNKFIELESKRLVASIIQKRRNQKEFLTKKWNYDDYEGFDIDETNQDEDDSLIEYKKVNLFPIVEKFTFLSGTDMYYWSGVIMRNSCRRNELRGGVRQCGNLECGKWEKYPREFLKCRRCKRTKYCSRECQMKTWHCHRNWCIPSTSSTTTSNTNASAPTHGGLNQDSNVGLGPDDLSVSAEEPDSQHGQDLS